MVTAPASGANRPLCVLDASDTVHPAFVPVTVTGALPVTPPMNAYGPSLDVVVDPRFDGQPAAA
jgi:hypothetical protein